MNLVKNKTRYLILGLLSEEPLSGYEIKKIVDWRFSFFWSESYGQIYPELSRLEAEGLTEAVEMTDKGRQEKRRHKITDSGMAVLKQWLSEPVETELVRYELLLKLYFSNHVSADVMSDHMKEFELAHKRQLELFSKFEKQLNETRHDGDNHREILMVLLFGQKVWQAYGDWSQEVLRRLGERE